MVEPSASVCASSSAVAVAKVVDQFRRGVPVAGDFVDDPRGDRLTDLGIPASERLTHAAHRASVIAPDWYVLGALRTRFHDLGDRTQDTVRDWNSR
jgi:hypothetical protein